MTRKGVSQMSHLLHEARKNEHKKDSVNRKTESLASSPRPQKESFNYQEYMMQIAATKEVQRLYGKQSLLTREGRNLADKIYTYLRNGDINKVNEIKQLNSYNHFPKHSQRISVNSYISRPPYSATWSR